MVGGWQEAPARPTGPRSRSRRWREYACESFCDSAACLLGGAGDHEEFTLARRVRENRRRWFQSLLGAPRCGVRPSTRVCFAGSGAPPSSRRLHRRQDRRPGVSTFVGQALGLRRPLRPLQTPENRGVPASVHRLPLARQSSGTAPLSGLQSDFRRNLRHHGPLARSRSPRPHLSQTAGHCATRPDFDPVRSGNRHYELHSWVIMPNRVHLLLTPQTSVSKLPGSLKAATAKRANLLLQRSGQPFWQDES